MGRKRKNAGGEPEAAKNPVDEDNGADPIAEPGAAASLESDDGPLPEDLEDEDTPPDGVPDTSPHVSPETPPPPEAKPKGAKVPVSAEVKPAPKDPRAELRTRLGEPAPHAGAVVDPQTGRVETPPPGWDPRRRPPQKP